MNSNIKIYYIMDTMCGWCYSFSEIINRIYSRYKEYFDFIILPAGMWVDKAVKTMNKSLAAFIKIQNKRIEELTGIKFGELYEKNILQKTGTVLDSLPGAKAVTLIQSLKNEMKFDYLNKIQKALFIDGKDTNDWIIYAGIAEEYGIDKELFREKYYSSEIAELTSDGFKLASDLKVPGFPSIFAFHNEKFFPVSQGLITFEQMEKNIKKLI